MRTASARLCPAVQAVSSTKEKTSYARIKSAHNSGIWRNRDEQTVCAIPPIVRKAVMDPEKILNWLIALSVAAGLLAAPLSVPAMAAQHPMAAAHEMQAMADEMPCCPDQKANDCGSCPFAALCSLTITLSAPESAGALMNRIFSRSLYAVPDDLLIDGFGEYPPDHPPRTIV
jgi:hypothetical protein